MTTLSTSRLFLRPWVDSDRLPFAKLNGDKDVMRYFPSILTAKESDATLERLQAAITLNGWGFWAVEERKSKRFVGFVGLNEPAQVLPCSPCVEIGWRLSKEFWGQGIATEAAIKALEFAFEKLGLDKVVSFTPISNSPSRAVMERIGMSYSGETFAHPSLPNEHPLAEHVLYQINRARWDALVTAE